MDKTYNDALIENIEEENLLYANERAFKKETKQSRINNLKLRKANLRKQFAKLVIAGGGLVLVAMGASKLFERKPLQVVTAELLADADLAMTDDGKMIDGQMTDQELLDYIEKHGLSLDDIREETMASLKSNMINPEFGMKKVEQANPEVFQEESKGISK